MEFVIQEVISRTHSSTFDKAEEGTGLLCALVRVEHEESLAEKTVFQEEPEGDVRAQQEGKRASPWVPQARAVVNGSAWSGGSGLGMGKGVLEPNVGRSSSLKLE